MYDLEPFIKKLALMEVMSEDDRKEHWEEMKPLLVNRLREIRTCLEFDLLWEKMKKDE